MMIPIDDDYRITKDKYQWILEYKSAIAGPENKKHAEGTPLWKGISFHTTVDSLLRRLVDLKLAESDATTLRDALNDVTTITDALSKALDPVAEVKWRDS